MRFQNVFLVASFLFNCLQVCSFHGTGTMANDKNESDVVHRSPRLLVAIP